MAKTATKTSAPRKSTSSKPSARKSSSSRKSSVQKSAARSARKLVRREYTAADVNVLKDHSRKRTPVAKIAKLMKRTEGSLRQKALKLGIGLGHKR